MINQTAEEIALTVIADARSRGWLDGDIINIAAGAVITYMRKNALMPERPTKEQIDGIFADIRTLVHRK